MIENHLTADINQENTPNPHPLVKIIRSKQKPMRLLKGFVLALLVVFVVYNLYFLFRMSLPPLVYIKDIIQEYLMGKAILAGVSPYLPLPELTSMFLGEVSVIILPHPSPHPPPAAFIGIFLALLPYQWAAFIWFLIELAIWVAAVYFVVDELDLKLTRTQLVVVCVLTLSWIPLARELIFGQLNTFLLLLLLLTYRFFKRGNEIMGGITLGAVVAIKLIAWPLVLYFAWKKCWKAVVPAGIVVLGANLLAGATIGFDQISYYYLQVSQLVDPFNRMSHANFSLWSIGWKVFEGTGSSIHTGITAPPLFASTAAARIFSIALPLIFVAVALILSIRSTSFEKSFSILLCASIIGNPVAWDHYLLLTLVPLMIIGRYLITRGFPSKETNLAIFTALMTFLPNKFVVDVMDMVNPAPYGSLQEVSFWVGLTTLTPLVGLLLMIWFINNLDFSLSGQPGLSHGFASVRRYGCEVPFGENHPKK